MAFRISIRVRLAFWYSLIVGISLSAFGVFTYLSVSSELHSNLDASLNRVAESLDYIIKERLSGSEKNKKIHTPKEKSEDNKFELFQSDESNDFVGPLRPMKPQLLSNDENHEEKNPVWSAVYEHILLNSRNYFIQISDTNNVIVWRTQNLQNDSLPILINLKKSFDEILKNHNLNEGSGTIERRYIYKDGVDSTYTDVNISKQDVRLYIKRTDQAVISVGYTSEDISYTLNGLFSILIIAFPILLIVSTIGGLILSKLSLRMVDDIAQTADEITASNLSRRLPESSSKDEFGHLTRTLNRMIERLEDSFDQIRQFTSDASHELRTPLTILQGELEIALHSSKTREEYSVVIASALDEVIRLSNVVETLLELSRADGGRVSMNFEPVNLSRLLTEISEDAAILAEHKGVALNTGIEPEVIVPIDPARIHQAVLNLIDNAVKYTPTGGNISIELKNGKNVSEIIVKDTGIGIPEDQMPHVFDRFYRVDKARSHDIQGSGLGLSIVKWIVDAHDGVIEVHSQVRHGSSFIVKLPMKRVVKKVEPYL